MPFSTLFLGEGSPTKINHSKKGTLILTSLLEDRVTLGLLHVFRFPGAPAGR